jgi:tetratricopeptide (TPR) repeat protein
MSFNPLVCEDCNIECVFEQIGLLPGEQAFSTVGVSWKCPKCSSRSLDMCFLGLNVPQKKGCLNCGELYQSDSCQGCGQTKAQEEKYFSYSSKDEAAKDLYNIFNRGLVRRAFLVANYILREDLTHEEAWKFKASGLNFLGLKDQRLNLFKEALAAGAPLSLLLSYGRALHDRGQFQEALDIYDKYLSSSQTEKKAVVLSYKANSMVALEKYDEAEKLFLAAIDADPQRIASYTDYVNLLGD